jgi:hypothetical protein
VIFIVTSMALSILATKNAGLGTTVLEEQSKPAPVKTQPAPVPVPGTPAVPVPVPAQPNPANKK